MLGNYDQNVGEILAVYCALDWLQLNRHFVDANGGKEVHIFTDSDLTYEWLTDPGVHCKYYRAVQRTRRLASYLTNYKIILHWIPSHLGKNLNTNSTSEETPLLISAK